MKQTASPLAARTPAPAEYERRRVERGAANHAAAGASAAGSGARDIASIATFLRDHPATSA